MSQPFASGRKALGICDRCGFTYLLHELRNQVVDLHRTGLLVCPACLDQDQPQLQLGSVAVSDPQALENPRPDTGEDASPFGDGAVEYEFLTDDDGWYGELGGSVEYVPAVDGKIEFSANGVGSVLSLGALSGPTILSLDSSYLNYIEMRIMMVNRPPLGVSWNGSFNWAPALNGDTPTLPVEPVWGQMGDPYTVISWDMRGVVGWDYGDTITKIWFSFFRDPNLLIVDDSSVLRIDYIRLGRLS